MAKPILLKTSKKQVVAAQRTLSAASDAMATRMGQLLLRYPGDAEERALTDPRFITANAKYEHAQNVIAANA